MAEIHYLAGVGNNNLAYSYWDVPPAIAGISGNDDQTGRWVLMGETKDGPSSKNKTDDQIQQYANEQAKSLKEKCEADPQECADDIEKIIARIDGWFRPKGCPDVKKEKPQWKGEWLSGGRGNNVRGEWEIKRPPNLSYFYTTDSPRKLVRPAWEIMKNMTWDQLWAFYNLVFNEETLILEEEGKINKLDSYNNDILQRKKFKCSRDDALKSVAAWKTISMRNRQYGFPLAGAFDRAINKFYQVSDYIGANSGGNNTGNGGGNNSGNGGGNNSGNNTGIRPQPKELFFDWIGGQTNTLNPTLFIPNTEEAKQQLKVGDTVILSIDFEKDMSNLANNPGPKKGYEKDNPWTIIEYPVDGNPSVVKLSGPRYGNAAGTVKRVAGAQVATAGFGKWGWIALAAVALPLLKNFK